MTFHDKNLTGSKPLRIRFYNIYEIIRIYDGTIFNIL